MELLVGLLGALIGTVAGAVTSAVAANRQMRRELEFDYDRHVRGERLARYVDLHRITGAFPRYWPDENPVRRTFSEVAEELDDWYFGGGGGLFLTDEAREAYIALLNELPGIRASGGDGEQPISDKEVEVLWRRAQRLRRQLAADIGSARRPAVASPPRAPSAAPPASTGPVD
jgi:hypothetical protein